MDDVASFRPGVWNGIPHDLDFIKQLVSNFERYSTGESPYYRPYISINHDDKLQAGAVAAARLKGDTLHLDGVDIPEPVGAWRNAGGISQPSIEYYEPIYDATGRLIDGFRCPDGSISPTPVLKCLTLLGADAPAVKGLPPLPAATFADRRHMGGRVRKFSNDSPTQQVQTMDRAAMLAALQVMGVDITPFTDVVPDEVMRAVMEAMQKMQATPAADAPPPMPTDPAQQFSDGLGGGVPAMPAPASSGIPGVSGNAQPSSVVLKFSDTTPTALQTALRPILDSAQATINALTAQAAQASRQLAAVNRTTAQQAHAQKFADVTAFVNKLATRDANGFVRIQPVQRASITALLMKCDNSAVRKFSDGKTTGTELAELKAGLELSLPKLRAFGDKMPDPQGDAPGATGSGPNGMDPDRRARMLKATPQGKKILAGSK